MKTVTKELIDLRNGSDSDGGFIHHHAGRCAIPARICPSFNGQTYEAHKPRFAGRSNP